VKEVEEVQDGEEMTTILHACFVDRGFNRDIWEVEFVGFRVCLRI
jgi:hypothetical protein